MFKNRSMKKSRRKRLVLLCIALVCIIVLVFLLFSKSTSNNSTNPPLTDVLTDSISRIVSACPGEIGVAIIINNTDTVKVNDKSVYPMMSVFKVHQALALCNDFDNKGISLDTLVKIDRNRLDSKTWSPMMKDYSELVISLTVRDLLRYTIAQSDNNASNLMFKDMVNVAQTDSFIATLIPRSSFQIAYTEEEMSADHDRAYFNYTSPLGAAMLMNRLFTESIVSGEKQSFIKNTLKECVTGTDRIVAPLLDKERVSIAHKTGSGYVNENGILAAHNDVAYICLPNNVCYTLAIFVKDFKGNESQASQYVAHISEVVYSLLIQNSAIP
jgi:beta-lactamase class A